MKNKKDDLDTKDMIRQELEDQLDYMTNKDKTVRRSLIKYLDEVDWERGDDKTRMENLIDAIFSKAVDDKDVNAMRLILAYTDGLPRQEIVMQETNKPRFVIGKVEIKKDENHVVEGEVVKDD